MNEYIKTAQELAKLPGTEKWPTRLKEIRGTTKTRFMIQLFSDSMRVEYPHERGHFEKEEWVVDGYEHGPFLPVNCLWLEDDEWSGAKWLERAFDGLDVDLDERAKVLGHCSGWFSSELDYNKAILAIGQRAWGLGEFAEWTLEQRKPWLDAWDRGQDVPT